MNDKDTNGWSKSESEVFYRLDAIDATNKAQTETLKKISDTQVEMQTELRMFKGSIKYIVGGITTLITLVYHTVARLIQG